MANRMNSERSEYRALVAKVEAFTEAVAERRKNDLTCSAGCSACCHAWLTVSAVEADELRAALLTLPAAEREAIRARGERELAREQANADDPRCALLDEHGRCGSYLARPLVGRTQGHALRYPVGFIPIEQVAKERANGDVTWCPLNYTAAEPAGADVLDAERVDQILAVVGQRYAVACGGDGDARFSLSALAAEPDVLHDRTARDPESDDASNGGE
jgi:uncharacterized protein